MKKYLSTIGVISLFVPLLALAATFTTDKNVDVGETVQGNLYLAGNNLLIAGTVNGDLLSAGSGINVTGRLANDAMLAGGSLNISGEILGDLRAAGGTLTLNSRVNGEAVLAGGQIKIGPNAVIGGDLVASGGVVEIDAAAQIAGQRYINSGKEAAEQAEREAKANPFAYYILPEIVAILVLLVAAVLLGLIFKEWIGQTINLAINKTTFWRNLGVGLAVLILIPVAIFILMLTGISALFGAILLTAYITLVLTSIVFAGMLFGGLMQAYFEKKAVIDFNWWWMLGGVIISHLLTLIPLVGWLFGLVLFLLAMGTLTSLKGKELRITGRKAL